MMRISLDSPALTAVRSWLAGLPPQPTPRSGRSGSRKAARMRFHAEQLEPRTMLDGASKTVLIAAAPDLVASSDTGTSSTDNLTYDRTPVLSGGVRGPVSQVRLFIDGRFAEQVPVTNGRWTHEVPAEAALAAGRHRIAVRPVDGLGRVGRLSPSLVVTTATAAPNAPTLLLDRASDSGARGDGRTNVNCPSFAGTAPRGQWVSVSIDGELVGRVRSHARTGAWSLKAPWLSNGTHDVTAVAENTAGLRSAATSFQVTVNGQRTVMLDGSDKNTVELMASHLLGRNSQGFIVTQVHRGTLQRWSAAKNAWVTIPTAPLNTDAAALQNAPAIRRIGFNETLRWTPSAGDVGTAPAFAICPSDTAGGLTAPTPEAGTVPGKVVNARLSPLQGAPGTSVTWSDPTDGCGCASTRYSIEVTREDGQTLVYSVPRTVHGIPIVEGGEVLQARIWGATKTGAGEARSYDDITTSEALSRLSYSIATGVSFADLGKVARAQLGASLTPTRSTISLPLSGTNAHLAYLQVNALPDATEAAQGLPAGTPMIISSESNSLTPKQLADLRENPIYASRLFPGAVNGEVQPNQVRAHFQAGEMLQFAGTVDASVRAGATVVFEEAQNLGDGSLGPWFEKGRIAVGADGSYSHNYVVPYGLNSVRVRLEYRAQPAQASVRASSVGATSSTSAPVSTPIDLSGSFNAFGISTAPFQAPNNQGFDRNGNYYNSEYTGSSTSNPVAGTPITYNGITFPIGPIPTSSHQVGGSGTSASRNPPNFVQALGQTINVSVDADKSDYLYLAGAASNGNQVSQDITLNFTDGTTETWTQSFHDWASVGPPQQDANGGSSVPAPRPFAGELLLKTEPERINQLGNLVTTPAHIFAYCRNLHGKQLASITLPNNNNIGILSAVVAKAPVIALDEGFASLVLGTTNLTGVDLMAMTIKNESNIGVGGGPLTFFMTDTPVAGTGSSTQPPTYTTTQVIVPMGQQKTIALVAPDSTSQMNFYVQKADGTCVGPNCSTYLTDWRDGSGRSSDFAANISPSLNSQMKSGQHWTMTIQNSAEGYYGYLDSPSGQGLPSANGSTPAGAQFKLMTQAEINSQPPWATALEEAIGILVGVAVLTVATGGVADYFIADAAVTAETETATAEVTAEISSTTSQTVTEQVAVDANAAEDGGAEADTAERRVRRQANISRGWWVPMDDPDGGRMWSRGGIIPWRQAVGFWELTVE